MASKPQKRSALEQSTLLNGVKAVLVDIEGTTTPISFVHDKLFGFVRDNLKEYLSSRWENEEVVADVTALRDQSNKDKEDGVEGVVEISKDDDKEKCVQSVVDNVIWQMDSDRKATPLKQLQGHMWREAYKTGKVQGEVFDDVVDALKTLTESGKLAYVYSSGSVEAQKLLFGYSDKGDLQKYFTGFFDTTTGAKTDKTSYATIAAEIGVEANEVLFLTDLAREAVASSDAGLKACIVIRDGNTPLSEEEQGQFPAIDSFAELFGTTNEDEPAAKKAAPDAEDDDDLGDVDDDDVVDDDEEEEDGGEEEDEEAS